MWLIAGNPTPPGQQRVCLAHGFMNQGGGGLSSASHNHQAADGHHRWGWGGQQPAWVVSGTVTKQAVRLRVLFTAARPWA